MIRECQLLLLASYSLSLCVPSWHFPFYFFLQTLVIYSRFLWSFSSREHTVFFFFPQQVVTFTLKQMLSLSSFIHIKIKTAFILPPLLWDEIIEAPLLSLAAESFQSFGPRSHRLRAYQFLILQVGEIEAQSRGWGRFSPEKPPTEWKNQGASWDTGHLVHLYL